MQLDTELRAPWADRRAPLIVRALAFGRQVYWEGWKRTTVRAPYGELSFGGRCVAFDFCCYSNPSLHLALPGVSLFLKLPKRLKRWVFSSRQERTERPQYGFSWRFGPDWGGWGAIHLHWGSRTKIVEFPWGWHKRKGDYLHEYLGEDGQWYDYKLFPHSWVDAADRGPPAWSESYPYPYLTHYGTFQDDITATITRERCHRIYRIFGFPTKRATEHAIKVEFDKEVGSERGSWKGGAVGCSESMRAGETPKETLMRMRRTRSFCR
ncbi:MAG: hypothetical protein U5M50_04115 [Sphingobium sp.]|nr:hypothetical protein [Sphingobium sp.]